MKSLFVIGIIGNQSDKHLARAIDSLLRQAGLKRELKLVLLEYGNETESIHRKDSGNVIHLKSPFQEVVANRNFLLQWVEENLPEADIYGRLDSDDYLIDNQVLQKIEQLWDEKKCRALLAGNIQELDGVLLPQPNLALNSLNNEQAMLHRLKQMEQGNPEAELPSCNLFWHPNLKQRYPEYKSGEDHALLVQVWLRRNEMHLCFAEEIIYCVYSLGGNTTKANKRNAVFLESRKNLVNMFLAGVDDDKK